MGRGRVFLFVFASFVACIAPFTYARPLVRNVKSDREFKALIKHHKERTGLPVVVDFFSHSCGPCRMIAPVFKRMAKQYKDKAVFAKVDVNANYQTSQRLRIRSMPTFHFYMNGKLRHQFSGADQRSLEQYTRKLAREAEKNNVRITFESLKTFYGKHDPEKSEDDIKKLLEKVGGVHGGAGHAKLVKALKKKYGESPKTEARTIPQSNKQKKGKGASVSLKDMPTAELFAELERRGDYVPLSGDSAEENRQEEEEDEDEESDTFAVWQPEIGFPERIAIVGAGPAGLSAAIYAARAGLRPVVVAPPLGGQLQGKGVSVENYPGVAGDTGPGIVAKMTQQAIASGATFLGESVTDIDLSVRPFRLSTNTTQFETHALVLATGANSRWLGVPGENDYRGGGVSTCATCDGFLYRDEDVLVVGGGDTAMEDALVLARTSKSVVVIHRRDEFRASRVLAQRVLEHPKIRVMWNSTVEAFEGESVEVTDEDNATIASQETLTHVVVRDGNDGRTTKLRVAAAFVAIGHDPNTGLVAEQIDVDDAGYVLTKHPTTATSVDGVFAAGDVADHIYRQAVTSAGTGCRAALDAERWLSEHGVRDERDALVDDTMSEVKTQSGSLENDDDREFRSTASRTASATIHTDL
eukprot:g2309.t1